MRLRFLLCLAAGVAFALGFPPYGLAPLLPVALACLVGAVRGRSVWAGAALGGAFGVGFFGLLLAWLRVIGVDAWVALALFESLYLAVVGAGLAVVTRLRGWPVWASALWLAGEVVRGEVPWGGLTWGRAVFATVDTPYANWLPWIGANGVSLLVALSGTGLLWVVLAAGRRRVAAALVAAGAVVVLLAPWPLAPPGERSGSTTVAVVQGDVPGTGTELVLNHREVTRSHVELTEELAARVARGEEQAPDWVLWPENSTAVDPFRDRETREGIADAVDAVGVPLVVGAIADAPDPDEVLNQSIVHHPGGTVGDRYTKRHPVPFGEYVPLRGLLNRLGFTDVGRLALIPRDMVAGTDREPLHVDGAAVAAAICFDVSYDDVFADQIRAGAETLVVQTSNALFIHTGQIEQQFAISRLRAQETGRALTVAAVNGRSGVIGPDGEVLHALPVRTSAVLVADVPLVRGTPPSVVVGPWLGRASLPAGLAVLVAGGLAYRREPEQGTRASGQEQSGGSA